MPFITADGSFVFHYVLLYPIPPSKSKADAGIRFPYLFAPLSSRFSLLSLPRHRFSRCLTTRHRKKKIADEGALPQAAGFDDEPPQLFQVVVS